MRFLRTFYRLCVASIFAGTLLSCAMEPRTPISLHPQFGSLGVERIALLPVVFKDRPLDRYYEERAGREIRWHARKVLTEKGYEVLQSDIQGKRFYEGPFVLPGSDPVALASLAPAGADAVLLIRVDDFLDAGLYEDSGPQFLEIYATAVMVSVSRRDEIWRDEGYASANLSFLSTISLNQELFLAPADLADSLFATLPDAAGGRR